MPYTTPYIGGQWKILSRPCSEFISSSPEVGKFRDYYENTLIPDESFFQTVLMNTEYKSHIIKDDKRAIIWIPEIGPALESRVFTESETNALIESGEIKLRPKTLTMEDLPYLLASDALFARKFDETIDGEILDELEKVISEK
jgi:Core-2/I-Branching enzyme